ncbi:MAG: helix-turn-helix domain-containing protein, partial [Streptosporangiaceae bacterium]
ACLVASGLSCYGQKMGKMIPGPPVLVGPVIRLRRKAAHLSQRELATMAGVSVGLVPDLE